jgi:hypothetical protein
MVGGSLSISRTRPGLMRPKGSWGMVVGYCETGAESDRSRVGPERPVMGWVI